MKNTIETKRNILLSVCRDVLESLSVSSETREQFSEEVELLQYAIKKGK